MSDTKRPYQWDYEGSWAPGGKAASQRFSPLRFSVGIFQWVPTADGKRLKKGIVVQRVKGYTRDPELVYAKAKAICAERERLYVAAMAKANQTAE